MTVAIVLVVLSCAAYLLVQLKPPKGRGLFRAEYSGLLIVTTLLAWETRDTSNEYLVASSALQYHAAIGRYREAAARRRVQLGRYWGEVRAHGAGDACHRDR